MNSTTSNNIERHYPLLETCNITLRSKNGNDRPPIHLPNDIVEWYQKQVEHQQQLNNKSNQKSGNSATTTATISTIPKPYDFALGTSLHFAELK